MIALSTIFEPHELKQPPAIEAVQEAERKLRVSLPQQLRELYYKTNGISGNWTVTIFEVEALYERNKTYETIQYLPNHIYIGNDNGNCGVFVSKQDIELTVYECDLGAQDEYCLRAIAPSLAEWFKSRCPWSTGELGVPYAT